MEHLVTLENSPKRKGTIGNLQKVLLRDNEHLVTFRKLF
jgi:hypothetical protein